MAFIQEPVRTATAIGDLFVTLYDADPTSGEVDGASYRVLVKFNDGSIVVRTGDLVPHLTQAQISSLLGFMAVLRQKAIDEFLP
jgi:hypothetical protein